jgi:amidase
MMRQVSIELIELTVGRALAALSERRMTAEELTVAFLARIDAVNPLYNAIIFLNPEAIRDAREIDRQRAAGETLGPLAGIPVVIKDTMDMVGFATTGGWSHLCSRTGGIDLLPQRDAPVVARLRQAGAIILGKTNVPVLSHSGSHANDSWAGPTRNPAGVQFLPGGSSTGTAAAVAASLAVLGLGAETGGSIQNPASAQGLVGVKPTFGLVPAAGVMPLSGLRDVVGPIARCVQDAAVTLDVLAGYSAEDPHSAAGIGHRPRQGFAAALRIHALSGKRVGLYGPGWRDQPLSEDAAQLYGRAQRELQSLGAQLVEDPFGGSGFAKLRKTTPPLPEEDARGLESLPYDFQQYLERLGPRAALRNFADFAAATALQEVFSPAGVLGYMRNLPHFAACLADPGRPPDLSDFVALREAHLEIIEAVFAAAQLDALVFPQMRAELPHLDSGQAIAETTVNEINIAGLPGVTVPAGYYASGAPFNLIFVGRQWSEAELLGYAYSYESATRHRHGRPRLNI